MANLPDIDLVCKTEFLRAARKAFLNVWVHTGIVSCAEAIVDVSKLSGDAWKVPARELMSGILRETDRGGGYIESRRVIEKATEIKRPRSVEDKQRRARPWDDWSSSGSSAGSSEGPSTEGAGIALFGTLMDRGRYQEALLAACRIASSAAGRAEAGRCRAVEKIWSRALEDATRLCDPADADAVRRFVEATYDTLASVSKGAKGYGASRGFESSLAAVLAVCSGDLVVTRGWRSSAREAEESEAAYMAALYTVCRRSGEGGSERVDVPTSSDSKRRTKTCSITDSGPRSSARRSAKRGVAVTVRLRPTTKET